MERILIYYSQNKNIFKAKVSRKYFIPNIGYKNQFDEVLVKIISADDLSNACFYKSSLFKHLYKLKNRKE